MTEKTKVYFLKSEEAGRAVKSCEKTADGGYQINFLHEIVKTAQL